MTVFFFPKIRICLIGKQIVFVLIFQKGQKTLSCGSDIKLLRHDSVFVLCLKIWTKTKVMIQVLYDRNGQVLERVNT